MTTLGQAENFALQLAQGMSQCLHWFPEDVSPERLAQVLVGMANTQGGSVLLGVAPRSAQVLGVSDIPGLMDCVFQAMLLADPALILPLPEVIHLQEKALLHIQVPAGLPHVYSLQGRYLGRDRTQTNPLPARQLRRLLVERGAIQFESLCPPGASLKDLDEAQIEAYLKLVSWPAHEPAEQVLLRRGCLRQGNGEAGSAQRLQPTFAGLLLFGKQPQRWLPNATLLAARFTGSSFSDRFIKQEIGGTLPQQLQQAEVFLQENIRRVVRMVGMAHQETPEYPFEAVRELLVNAVAHRDYNIQGDNIHLNLFSDRIEVQSPGGLPGPVNLQNLLQARFSRNVVIVQVLADLGYVERLGYGLDRVVSAARQHGLPAPIFEEIAGTFRATLMAATPMMRMPEKVNLAAHPDLNPRQQAALSFLGVRPRITNRDLQELCPDVHAETIRRDLVDMVSRGLLIKVGDKKSTYYILK